MWWDNELATGDDYQETIDTNLRQALVVVVLWSTQSVKSRWVRSEATIGDRYGALAPVMIEACDRPVAFELVQSADLISWRGDRNDPVWKEFIRDTRGKAAARRAKIGATKPAPNAGAVEAIYWQSIKDGGDPADFQSYLARYPKGQFARDARARLNAKASRRGPPLMALSAFAVVAMACGYFLLRPASGTASAPASAPAAQSTRSDASADPAPSSAVSTQIHDPLVRRAIAMGLLGRWCGDAGARGGDLDFTLVDGEIYVNEVRMHITSVEGRVIATAPYAYTIFDDHMRYDIFGDYRKC